MGNNQSICAQRVQEKRKLHLKDSRSVKPTLSLTLDKFSNIKIRVPSKEIPMMLEDDASRTSSQESESVPVKILRSNTKEFPLGSVVLAKLKEYDPYWPAVVVHGSDVAKHPAKTHCSWVFWLGSRNISEVRKSIMIHFDPLQATPRKGKMFNQGLTEAQRELDYQRECASMSVDTEKPLDEIGTLTEYMPLTPCMWTQLKEFKSEHASRLSELVKERFHHRLPPNSPTHKARSGLLDLKDFCISCDDSNRPVTGEHPVFIGGICEDCLVSIKETIFDCGVDGVGSYCIICANPGDLLVCDHPDCIFRTFCTDCMNRLVSQKATEEALSADFWHCFLCSNEERGEDCLIRIRSDWRSRLLVLFGAPKECAVPEIDPTVEKRSITVLSLFDGISTGRIALDTLGLSVNKYYASELDSDAMLVSSLRLKEKVVQLGPVESLTEERLANLDPVDLVIGGSPCNDLSLVNPDRKGLYNIFGTGVLFFEFFRVLKTIQQLNKNRHVFWMFENVASMPMEYRAVINRFFQSEPSILDARYFSAQRRPRFFWGNIPGMHSPLSESLNDSNHKLQTFLDPGRIAVVPKLGTVTTNSNSLVQGKDVYPIKEKGNDVLPTISELEKIFGFPNGYTDDCQLSRTQRLKLLGKSWSVPVIVHILRPLKTFFSS